MSSLLSVTRDRSRQALVLIGILVALTDLAPDAEAARSGDRLWTARYEGQSQVNDTPVDVLGPAGGLVYVTGVADGDGFGTIAYSATTGERMWVSRFAGVDRTVPSDMALSPEHRTLYVTGYDVETESGDDEILTIALAAATGKLRWSSRCCATQFRGAGAVAADPDGTVIYLMGQNSSDIVLAALNASNGHLLWHQTYGHRFSDETAKAMELQRDGSSLFVTGYRRKGSTVDALTFSVDPTTGARRWTRTYDSGGGDFPADLAASGSRVYVAGTSGGSSGSDIEILVYRNSGDLLWTRRYDDPGGGDEIAHAMAVSSDGSRLAMVGSATGSGGDTDYVALAYGPEGGLRWARRYQGPADEAVEADISIGGGKTRVFVTGGIAGRRGHDDLATVALGLTRGRRVWAHRYDGPKEGDDEGIAISAGRRAVYVVGSSEGRHQHGSTDYVTVAYAA